MRAFLEGNPSEMLSKVGVIDGAVMKKSKKHCTGASPESPSIVKNNKFEPFGIHPADPPDPDYQVSGAAARNHHSTRAGGQDDVSSKQTPSN